METTSVAELALRRKATRLMTSSAGVSLAELYFVRRECASVTAEVARPVSLASSRSLPTPGFKLRHSDLRA